MCVRGSNISIGISIVCWVTDSVNEFRVVSMTARRCCFIENTEIFFFFGVYSRCLNKRH